uniref:Uncharacterized protein n=1 Tax=virus sp. ctML55 TaxID=2827627 RepID=A0A8S5RJ77_9VIRU|nr:MAG TPA: hypothetical protein [virus sp. ctML55]
MSISTNRIICIRLYRRTVISNSFLSVSFFSSIILYKCKCRS